MDWRLDREPETYLAALCNKTHDSHVNPVSDSFGNPASVGFHQEGFGVTDISVRHHIR